MKKQISTNIKTNALLAIRWFDIAHHRYWLFAAFIIYNLTFNISFSQSYQWAIAAGNTNDDQGNCVVVDASGNVYNTGFFQGTVDFDPGSGTTNLISNGAEDIYFAKYNSAGALVWVFGMGSAGTDAGNGIAVDAAGNVYITGAFANTVDFDPGSGTTNLSATAANDCYIAKYNSAGVLQWAFKVGAGGSDSGHKLFVDQSNNLYVAGYFSQTADFDPSGTTVNLVSNGSSDGFLAAYTTAGALQWAFNIGANSADVVTGVTWDVSGNLYITGDYTGTADFDPSATTHTLTSNGGKDIFVASYDANGNYLWAFNVGGTLNDEGDGIAIDATTSKIYFTGYFQNTADFDPSGSSANLTSNGIRDICVASYNSSGNYLWAFNIGSISGDEGHGIAVDPNGDIYVAGHFQQSPDFDPGSGTSVTAAVGAADIFLASYTSGGAYLWSFGIGSIGADICWSLAADPCKLYTTGLIAGIADFDPGSATVNPPYSAGSDVFIGKYTTGTANPQVSGNTSVCSGNAATLNASGGVSFAWNPSTGLSSTTATSISVNIPVTGAYTLTATSFAGCKGTIGFTVTVNITPTVTASASISSFCSGLSSVITANGATTYNWNPSTTLSSATASSVTATPLANISYTVTGTTGLCSAKAVVTLTVNALPTLTVISTDATCGQSNGSATANVSGGTPSYNYLWNNGATQASVVSLQASVYSVTVTDMNGCAANSSVTINSIGGVTAQIISSASVTCNGDSTGSALAGGTGGATPYSYLWSNGSTTSSIYNLTFNIYNCTVTDANNCTSTASVSIDQSSPLYVNLIALSSCIPGAATASASPSGGTGPYNYSWSDGGLVSQISNLTSQIYSVTVTDANNCRTDTTFNIISGGGVVATAMASDTSITMGDTILLVASGGDFYSWDPSTGVSCGTCSNTTASLFQTTTYCVMLSDSAGCNDTACVTINVDTTCEPFIPTAFSPNADSLNEMECVYANPCFSEFLFRIFNRWGEIVFETRDLKKCWNGMYKNVSFDKPEEPVNLEVFYYTFDGVKLNGEKQVQKGTITLVK